MRALLVRAFKNIVPLEQLWLTPALLIAALYFFSSIIGLWVFRTQLSFLLITIIFVGIFSYLFSYKIIQKNVSLEMLLRNRPRLNFSVDYFILVASACYFTVIIYSLITAEKIALIEALRGANAADIAYARETLFKTRQGPEKIILYLNAILSSAVMPYALAVAYLEKKNYRYWLIALFVLSLLPSLEKVLILKAFLPIIILGINRYISLRTTLSFIAITLGCIYLTTSLSKMSRIEASHTVLKIEQDFVFKGIGNDKESSYLKNRFELIETDTPLGFILNRALWIPYITAYDWLLYFKYNLNWKYLKGRTSALVSWLTKQTQFNMDRAVFTMQFGGGIVSTGSANTLYLVDAFVNFSWAGVILFSAIVAAISRLIVVVNNPIFKSCYYYYIYLLACGSLFGVLFSNGLILFILIALISPSRQYKKVSEI